MNQWVEKKLYHLRRSFLPHILALNARKVVFALRGLFHGTLAVPVLRNSSANMTFIVRSLAGRRKLYEIDSDPDLFKRAYSLFEGDLLPRMLQLAPPFVSAQWIVGESLSDSPDRMKAELLAGILARIHSRRPEGCPPDFHHLDRLKRRFDENLRALDEAARSPAMALRNSIERTWSELEPGLSCSCVHPDMIASNVILHTDGHTIIDNEFFSAGKGREFDILNTFYSLSASVRPVFLETYEKLASLEDFHRHRDFWENVLAFKKLSRAMRFRNKRLVLDALSSVPRSPAGTRKNESAPHPSGVAASSGGP